VLSQIILEISNDGKGGAQRKPMNEQQDWDTDGRNNSNVYPLFGNSQHANSKKH
jgi:hypothetical protein